jgi:hypothetical protein
MVQQLMSQGATPQGMGGQNASTPYGMSFVTGNQSMPNPAMLSNGSQSNGMPTGMLGQNAPSTVLQQPMQSYAGA